MGFFTQMQKQVEFQLTFKPNALYVKKAETDDSEEAEFPVSNVSTLT